MGRFKILVDTGEVNEMRILCMNEKLTVIRTMEQARKVLEEVRKQEVSLSFRTNDSSLAIFKPQENNEWTVWEPDESWSIPIELQPSIRMDEDDTIKKLWNLRKHYNAKWRE